MDGPCIRLREGNLSEEFQRTREIDCVHAIQRTDVCLQITGKTEEPMFSNAEIVRAVITCFRFRIANKIPPVTRNFRNINLATSRARDYDEIRVREEKEK